MSARIGFDRYTIEHRGLTPRETLAFARSHGLDGVQFLEPAEIDSALDPGRLTAFRQRAEALGLYLEIGLPSPNPARKSRLEGRQISIEEHAHELLRHAEAASRLGCRHARLYLGDRHDRFRKDPPWPDQIDASARVLERIKPALLDLGLRVAIENHADLTADELLRLVDRLGPRVAAVTLDTGNLAMRLDDPIRAVERLAPWVASTHVKDCVLARSPRGYRWQARPVGSGVLPMPDLLSTLLRANPGLNLSIELHPRTYDLPVNDPTWLAYFPELRSESLAAVARLAELSEARFSTGFFERPEEVEAVPWDGRDLDWLASSLGYLRSVVPALVRLDIPPSTAAPARHLA
jgi:sugar phosphate isomerase/epimerase